jgi:hypothetical protein
MVPKYEVIIIDTDETIREAEIWCKENLGTMWSPIKDKSGGQWAMFYHRHSYPKRGQGSILKDHTVYRFLFMEEKDAMWFTLKWT